jgi:adenosylcobinamide-phosphate synthase
MAAFAGALGIQLGGTTYYRDKVKHYDTWGEPLEPLQLKHIVQAQRLVVLTTLMFVFVCVFIVAIYFALQ